VTVSSSPTAAPRAAATGPATGAGPAGHPRRWTILGVLVVSLMIVVLDNTVLNVALRTIADPRHGLGATQSQLEWAINSYTLVFAGLLFSWGVLGDRWGRRRVLLVGMMLFGLASLASAYAQNPGQLIGARALMGIGGAAVLPATLSIISNVFEPRERARAIGTWAGAVGLAVAIGPILGGLLLEHFWWGSVFLINVPVVLVGIVAIRTIVPESRDPRPARIDAAGVLLSIAGLVALVYGIVDAGEHGFDRVAPWAWMGAGALVLAMFIAIERRSSHPAMDVRLFRDPRFTAAVGATFLVFFAGMGTFFFSSFYLQLVRGYTPLASGAMLVPFAAAQLIFAPRSAALVRRFGPRAVCAAGLALVASAVAGLATLGADTPIWVFGVLMFVQGTGMANVMPPATESIMSSLPREKAGVGSAVGNTFRQVGGALGVAVLGSLISGVYRDRMAAATAALPRPAAEAAQESVAGGHAVAARLGAAGRGLAGAADQAFLHAMHGAALAASAVALAGVVVVLLWLPRRSDLTPGAARAAGQALERVVTDGDLTPAGEVIRPVSGGPAVPPSRPELARTR
jgi:DHA2 family multidrug resistance protein-like MFS transporter